MDFIIGGKICRAMDNGIHDKLLSSQGNEVGDLKERVYDESKKIWRIALPGMIARVASFGSLIVTQSFIGHISSVDLAGYALVQTLTVRFVNGILVYFWPLQLFLHSHYVLFWEFRLGCIWFHCTSAPN